MGERKKRHERSFQGRYKCVLSIKAPRRDKIFLKGVESRAEGA